MPPGSGRPDGTNVHGYRNFRVPGYYIEVMRLFWLPLSLICAASLVPSAAYASTQARNRGCPPARSHVVLSNKRAFVYKATEYAIESEETVGGGQERYRVPFTAIRGCAAGHRRTYKLGTPAAGSGSSSSDFTGIKRFALGGTMVAYEESFGGCQLNQTQCNAKWFVVVRNLITGSVVHRVPTGTAKPPNPGVVGAGEALQIIVKSDGSVAWITLREAQLHVLDGEGGRVLASGVERGSLKIEGAQLSWRVEGKLASARFS
jgi:hypothetical protein